MDNTMDKANHNSVPVPKPRNHLHPAPESSKTSYENVSIDLINKSININADNLQNSVRPKVQDKTFIFPTVNKAEPNRNVINEMNNLNNNKNATKSSEESNKLRNLANENAPKPVPAPRRQVSDQVYENMNQSCSGATTFYLDEASSGAASKTQNVTRKAPAPPEPVKFETPRKQVIKPERRHKSVSSAKPTDDVDFASKPTLVKSTSTTSMNSNNSNNSSETSPKYNNPSPGALLKSISATSKLLSESISERVNVKTKEARHKFDKIQKSSREKLSETTKTATSKLKNVRMKLGDNFSLGRPEPKMPQFSPDRPQTMPPNDPIFNSITFQSPLRNKSNNSYNLPVAESSYEIPKAARSRASDLTDDSCPPTYEESQEDYSSRGESSSPTVASSSSDSFNRNTNLTQSLHMSNRGKLEHSPLPAIRIKNKSETNLSETIAASNISLYPSLSSITDDPPCPNFPPPVLNTSADGVYGKIMKSNYSSSTESDTPVRAPTRTKRRKDYEATEIRLKPAEPRQLDNISTRATIDSDEFVVAARSPLDRLPRVFSRDVSNDFSEKVRTTKETIDENPMKSDSWSFYDVNNDDDRTSSPEPIYANDSNCNVMEPVYGMICDMESTDGSLLKPESVARKRASHPKTISEESSSDVLREFDPLIVSTVDEIFANRSNELLLLENLLGEETYGPVVNDANDDNDHESSEATDDEDDEPVAISTSTVPEPPRRQDSLNLHNIATAKVPKTASSDSAQNRPSVIIHQNMSLRSDSIENMLEEDAAIEPYLAKCDETSAPMPVDFGTPAQSQSNWFINEEEEATPSPSTSNNQVIVPRKKKDEKQPEKVIKNVLKPTSKDEKPLCDPPSYSEAIGEGQEKHPQKSSSMKSMFSNVLNKMEGINLGIKRKPSFKGSSKNEVKTLIEMIPKPPLTNRLILHEGHLIRLPSGVVDDILKEQHFRKAYIRERKFQAYFDKELKTAKENFPLEHITTVQCVSTHKFTNNSMDVYCFEITTSVPKGQSFSMSNPNVVVSTTDSGNAKSVRTCHLYGVGKEAERYVWMQKLLDSMTDVFPTGYTCKFYRAGWCYLKVGQIYCIA